MKEPHASLQRVRTIFEVLQTRPEYYVTVIITAEEIANYRTAV